MRSPLKLLCAAVLLVASVVVPLATADELSPGALTKYMDALPIPGPMPMAGPNYYEIGAWQVQQKLHAQLPLTTVWGYGPTQATASYPAATIEATRGVPIDIRWTNHLPGTHLLDYAIDPTIMKAYTTTGVPITPHVHGNEVEPQSDGGPHTWFTPGFAEKGPDWKHEVYHYVNNQLPATLWYHDHAFGFTRHNVYAGLAGFYILRDPGLEPAGLPSGPYEIPIAIQDKMLTTDGELWYPDEGETPEHPIWVPEFFGNLIIVNGKLWPYLNVEPRKYRFRLLNGSNARFYSLGLAHRGTGAAGPAIVQIGSDGGYLAEPVVLNDPANPQSPRLVMAPGERCDVIVDFSAWAPGTEFLLKNTAKAPFPNGEAADPNSVGQIMLFRVVPSTGPDESVIPANLATVERLTNPTVTRTMTLNEVMGMTGPLEALLNGMRFDAPATEFPALGSTEMWEVVNTTGDAHPIHLHLVQFQLLNRQRYNTRRYQAAFDLANPELGESYTPVDVTPYLQGKPRPADANERGWKDTFRMNPGEVTRILVRFAPQDDSPAFAFDATAEPGYVWHCHILEHEENDMMRPYHLVAPAPPTQPLASGPVGALAGVTMLREPQPNPTTMGATFRFALREPGRVELALYNVAGQRVRQLSNGPYAPGEASVVWDGRDDAGRAVPPGVYFVHLRAGGVTATRKLLVAP